MSTSLILACLWLALANVIGMLPSKKKHWPAAYVLISFGVPIVGFVIWQNGIWVGLVALTAGASILRWPVIFLMRWLKGTFAGHDKSEA